MKLLLIGIGVIILIVAGFFIYTNLNKPVVAPSNPNPVSTPIPSTQPNSSPNNAISFCKMSDLDGQINSEGAAGNIFAKVTLKNISSMPCQVKGDNQLSIDYPNSVTNIKTNLKTQTTLPIFTLAPNQTIYSQLHFPNGPQCSSPVTQVNAAVYYAFSTNGDSVTFTPNGSSTLQIPSCNKASEITTIDTWSFSQTPITQ